MSLYKFNQQAYAALPSMDSEALEKSKDFIHDFLNKHDAKYYLMLCNEIRYYTVYTYTNVHNVEKLVDEIIEITSDLGEIKSIETDGSGQALEFWIMYEGECHMFLLFNYDRGVVEI